MREGEEGQHLENIQRHYPHSGDSSQHRTRPPGPADDGSPFVGREALGQAERAVVCL